MSEPLLINTVNAANSDTSFVQHEKIRRGETLSSLLSRMGVNDDEIAGFVRRDRTARGLLELRPGRTVSATLSADRSVESLNYRLGSEGTLDQAKRLVIRRSDGRLEAVEEPLQLERSVEIRSAEVRRTLAEALEAADIPDSLVTRMGDIFGTEVDLRKDVRRGDRLRVVYQTVREAGSLEPATVERILAVQFRGGQRKLEAVWFDRGNGNGDYYSFDGRSLSRTFLASPLEFTRVSSNYTEARLHPIFRDWRAHKGVDMHAPIGTKVRTTADGTIKFIGRQNGYGNVIIVQHNARYQTLYAHLNDFAQGLEQGSRVLQGDVIGTVGMTGWSTGPHLHFEFHIDGEHVDPMAAIEQSPVRLLQGDEKARFTEVAAQFRNRFGLLESQLVARFE
ncbi:MAG: peptidoglycan DD-metalloendopeptidase family protein [Burkholderiales bacterium]|nr:peptidoglycan DD-metalloendopeptidase family protein [Burkholderiales bacterium]